MHNSKSLLLINSAELGRPAYLFFQGDHYGNEIYKIYKVARWFDIYIIQGHIMSLEKKGYECLPLAWSQEIVLILQKRRFQVYY